MDDPSLVALAALLRERNDIDSRIGELISRPMTAGHAGEWIAARIFDIQLEPTAVAKAIDGRIQSQSVRRAFVLGRGGDGQRAVQRHLGKR